jgi:HK97 family phage portal protein
MTATTWYNAERVSQSGSVVLKNWMASRSAAKVQASVPISEITPGTEMYDIMTGGLRSVAGQHVTERSAMSVAAVYACVGLIGGAIASMPFHLFKRTDNGRDRYDSDLWWLFNESPFDGWTAASAWHFCAQSVALRGDGFWQIHRASPYTNTIIGLEPLLPALVDKGVREKPTDPYPVTDRATGAVRYVDPMDMLHFPGIGFDGLRSLTPIAAALRPAASIAMAADQYAGAFFANGARADFAVTVPGNLSKEQRDTLRETWASRHSGVGNAHLPAVLSGGMDVKQLTMSAEDAQLLSTRKHQVEDVARIFGVPPHMIGYTEKSSSWGSGIEQMSIGFVRYTVGRYLDAIAQEINRKVWPRNRQVFGEFNRDSLLEGDTSAQSTYFSKALGGPGTQGWMLVNEVRKLKNLPPIPGGDQLVIAGAPAQTNPQEGTTP